MRSGTSKPDAISELRRSAVMASSPKALGELETLRRKHSSQTRSCIGRLRFSVCSLVLTRFNLPLSTGENSPPPDQTSTPITGHDRPPWTSLGRRSRFLRGVAHAQGRILGHLWWRQSAPPWSVPAFRPPRRKSLGLNRLPLVLARLRPLRIETRGGSISAIWSEHTLPDIVPPFVPPSDLNSDT